MSWAKVALTLVLLALCSFAPGFLVVRRLRWRPLEKLCGAVAASLIAIYLVAGAAYCLAPESQAAIFRAVAAGAAAVAMWRRREIGQLARSFGARQALRGFGFLLAWSLVALAIVRNVSGAGWAGDWAEHFQRSLFFLYHLPGGTKIVGNYVLPARPPLMNLLAAFYMAQTADLFEIYQVVFVFLNLLAFLPCCLLLHALGKGGRAPFLPLVALFALNPMMMENAWYSWTKLLAAFFVLFGLWLYLAGVRKRDSVRIGGAFLTLAAGLLVHYSAGPYVVFVAAHYVLRVLPRRPHRARELAVIVISCSLLLATWFGWSVHTYGAHTTLASNTSVTYAREYQGSAAGKTLGNLWDSIVPGIVRGAIPPAVMRQPNLWGWSRDMAFLAYQVNLIFAMGCIGGPFALWLVFTALRDRRGRMQERGFWLAFLPTVVILGIAVVGERDTNGVAHLTLLPLEALGLTLIAARFPWRRGMAGLLLAGCTIDFGLGIFLHLRVERLENTPQHTYFPALTLEGGRILTHTDSPDMLGGKAWDNWFVKNRLELSRQWMNELKSVPGTPDTRNFVAMLQTQMAQLSRDFGGWYGRHGGRITFLGDHFSNAEAAGVDAPSVVFALLFFGLMARFSVEAMRTRRLAAKIVVAAKAPERRAGTARGRR